MQNLFGYKSWTLNGHPIKMDEIQISLAHNAMSKIAIIN